MFTSFLQGGFEASSHRRSDGRQLDVLAACRHDVRTGTDYRLLRSAGLRTVRDALRWHRIEARPGVYDWSSFVPMLRAARDTGTQVIWDVCHYGVPHHLDIWSPSFPDQFARFARAAARVVRDETDAPPWWCPVNEISFWSWAGGHIEHIYPYGYWMGSDLKRQLVRAAIAAAHALREVDSRARFLHCDPLIHIIHDPGKPEDAAVVEGYRLIQYEAWDMIAGRTQPELGGSPDLLDVMGANFYFNNQWIHEVETVGMGHRLFRPFREMMQELHDRYGRPVLVAETGAEGGNGTGWMRYVCHEVRAAMRRGVPVEGVCLYPVMDYPGWDDDRHCPSGLIRADSGFDQRWVESEMAQVLAEEADAFAPYLARRAVHHPIALAAE